MTSINLSDYNTDKSPAYLANYRKEFEGLFDKPVKVLEIGVQGGGSMLLLRDMFPQGTIAGLDLNPSHVDDESGRIKLYQGFQQDPAILDQICEEVAPDGFDIIIDDGSHIGEYTQATFWHLFPTRLKKGGVYVLDDWSCAYWRRWSDGHIYTGREAVRGTARGPRREEQPPSPVERAKRKVRASARPLAARLSPEVRSRLERVYMTAEGAVTKKRFPSHDYGMAGFIKQLIDATAVDAMRFEDHSALLDKRISLIESVRVTNAQAFVRRSDAEGVAPSGS